MIGVATTTAEALQSITWPIPLSTLLTVLVAYLGSAGVCFVICMFVSAGSFQINNHRNIAIQVQVQSKTLRTYGLKRILKVSRLSQQLFNIIL